MTRLAEWLLLISAVAPLAGVACGLMPLFRKEPRPASAHRGVGLIILCGGLSSLLLCATLNGLLGRCDDVVAWRIGTVLEIAGPRPLKVEWAWRADAMAAGWLTVLSGLSGWMLLRAPRDASSSSRESFAALVALVHGAAVGFVLSANLVQMLWHWWGLALSLWLMMGWTSTHAEAAPAMRRAILTGLATEGCLCLAVLLLGANSRTLMIDGILSSDGLALLGERNPALPGFVGCLLVLGVLGRSGLFPCFGWHRGAAAWEWPQWTMVYLAAYVPSAVWLLWRFHPLVASSEASLAVLGGLGTLGAVVGAFVACGQEEPRRAAAFLVTAQVGVVLAAMSCGWWSAESSRAITDGVEVVSQRGIEVVRVALGQGAVVAGLLLAWRMTRRPRTDVSRTASSSSLVRLSRERLYVDDVTRIAWETPLRWLAGLAQLVERQVIVPLVAALTVEWPGWFGRQIEALQTGRVEFDLAATLLGAAAVLLTLVLVT